MSRSSIDVRRVAEAIKGAGIDTRHWCSYGTVGTVDDTGEPDYTAANAVIIAPDGVWADVVLQPLGLPVTARVQLGAGGQRSSFQVPIYPGDEVLVHIPDGDFGNPPTITAILNNQGDRVPRAAGVPIAKNDRVFLWAKDVPVEINAIKIQLGDETSAEPMVLGDKYKAEITTLLDALKLDIRPSPVGPIAPSSSLLAAVDVFEASLPDQLSDFIFGKKAVPTR